MKPARPKLLDLFCGSGGCSVGYHRAGFDVTGVDSASMPRYPFESIRADALEYVAEFGCLYDVIHASPPCQAYSRATFCRAVRKAKPDLLGPTRDLLVAIGKPWVIENVTGAPVQMPAIQLCGLMFGLKVFRHRWFESSELLTPIHHPSHRGKYIGIDGYACVAGHGGGSSYRERARRIAAGQKSGMGSKAEWEAAMGIDWMTRHGLSQAIPPAYCNYVGRQILRTLENTV